MSQYKEAHEKMKNTGSGLEGFHFANFQDYIVKNVCKYYFELDPVLKDRPNVYPWVTNEDEYNPESDEENTKEKDHRMSIVLSSDEDDNSMESLGIISKNENYQRNTQHATRITNKI